MIVMDTGLEKAENWLKVGYVCVCVYMYVYVCVCIYIYIYIYIYTCMHDCNGYAT